MSRARSLGMAAWIVAAEAKATHDNAVAEYVQLQSSLAQVAAVWAPLPVTPYPPASDTSGIFPETGDTTLLVRPASVSALQLAEPARAQASLVAQAAARRPTVTPLFWIGLACLGAGYFLAKR